MKTSSMYSCARVGLALTLVAWATPSFATPTTPPMKVEFHVGPSAFKVKPLLPAADLQGIPKSLAFVATYVPPVSVSVAGLVSLAEDQTLRSRAATLDDAARVGIPIAPEPRAPGIFFGAGLAGAAAALHPTFIAPKQRATVRLDPNIWPPGFVLQGVF